jgi:hypothetical protein
MILSATLSTGTFGGTDTVTLSDGQGGWFAPYEEGLAGPSPLVITPTSGQTGFNFTYTPAVVGQRTITAATNLGSIPTKYSYVASFSLSSIQSVGSTTCDDGQGNPKPGVVMTFSELLDPAGNESDGTTQFSATSDENGYVAAIFRIGATYRVQRGTGPPVSFVAQATAFNLPETLGP